jgi:CRISPR-associated protein Cas1
MPSPRNSLGPSHASPSAHGGKRSSLAKKAEGADTVESLLGLEGTAARVYFERFAKMLKGDAAQSFELDGRNLRPIALDLVEEMRPLVADSTVITALNTGAIVPDDFEEAPGAGALSAAGRKKFLAAWERRVQQLVAHPIFGYRVSYRRVLEVQARLLGPALLGEIPAYPPFRTPVRHTYVVTYDICEPGRLRGVFRRTLDPILPSGIART